MKIKKKSKPNLDVFLSNFNNDDKQAQVKSSLIYVNLEIINFEKSSNYTYRRKYKVYCVYLFIFLFFCFIDEKNIF